MRVVPNRIAFSNQRLSSFCTLITVRDSLVLLSCIETMYDSVCPYAEMSLRPIVPAPNIPSAELSCTELSALNTLAPNCPKLVCTKGPILMYIIKICECVLHNCMKHIYMHVPI